VKGSALLQEEGFRGVNGVIDSEDINMMRERERVKATVYCAMHWAEEYDGRLAGRPDHECVRLMGGGSIVRATHELLYCL
jgi:hypothetical protein